MSELDYFTEEQKENARQTLIKNKASSIQRVVSLKEELFNITRSIDTIDIASNEEERGSIVAKIAREENVVVDINAALSNFSDFGYCIDCGDEIGLQRLEIKPSAMLCIECQNVKDKKSRNFL